MRSPSNSNKEVSSLNKKRQTGWRRGTVAAITLSVVVILVLALSPAARAHGVELSYRSSEGIEVYAAYDNGEPIAGAQVTIYAPGEPSEPWLTGTCDEKGSFFFVPDAEIAGTWEVKVRKAGHGGILRVEVEEGSVESSGSGGFSTMQIVVMSLAVLWGLIGTALFFSRRKRDAHP